MTKEEGKMKVIFEDCRGEMIEEEVESTEEGKQLASPSEIWRVEDEKGNVLDSSDS